MITIYVGDNGTYLSKLAFTADPTAKLIVDNNFSNLSQGTYYTSLADLGNLKNFGAVLQKADKIVLAPPEKWSDEKDGVSQMYEWVKDYLNVFGLRCKIENYLPDIKHNSKTMLELADKRKTNSPQLWIAGCSFSHGIGVNPKTRYGQLLADKLNLESSFLTAGSSSIVWAADQILRSDIKSKDIVVWGLTAWTRKSYFINNNLTHVNVQSLPALKELSKHISPDDLLSDDLFYRSLTSIFQVINFCKKINATLVIASLLDDEISWHIKDFCNLIMLYKLWGRDLEDRYLDLGSDNLHPGQKTHAFYAEEIYNLVQQLIEKNN